MQTSLSGSLRRHGSAAKRIGAQAFVRVLKPTDSKSDFWSFCKPVPLKGSPAMWRAPCNRTGYAAPKFR